ncbi:MAG: cytochrome c family protein [Alphaproteobacteria bacterium]
MSTFEWNKIAGAILVALLVIKVIDIAGNAMPHAKTPAKHAYPIEGVAQAQPAGSEAKEAKKEAEVAAIGPLLAKASAEAGQKAARKCAVCHSFDKGGPNKVGPALWGVIGHKMGEGSFNFSDAMKKKGVPLDYETLNRFLHDPKKFVPGTKMAFAGVKNDKERADIIAYMRTLSDNPPPLP